MFRARPIFVFAVLALLVGGVLTACGEIDVSLPSGVLSYQVGAWVGDYSLNDRTFLDEGEQIRPYYMTLSGSERDITALAVSIQASSGKVLARYIYQKSPYDAAATETTQTESDAAAAETTQAESDAAAAETTRTEPVATAAAITTTEAAVEVLAPVESAENVENAAHNEEEDVEEEVVTEDFVEPTTASAIMAATQAAVTLEAAPALADVPAEAESVPEETPVESSASSEPGAASLGLEESLPDVIVPVSSLSAGLSAFSFPSILPPGEYRIVFQLFMDNNVIYRSEKPVYYFGGKKLILNDIQSYSPGVSVGSQLVSAGQKILLHADIEYDEEVFDPWIVWYCGNERLKGGKVSEETADDLIWNAPQKSGFQTLRVEVFPSEESALSGWFRGKKKELSLSVSTKVTTSAFFAENSRLYSQWFRLWGDLFDSKRPKSALVSVGGKTDVKWLPYAGTYGLAVGGGYTYALPTSPFLSIEKGKTSAMFLLRFVPNSAGSLINVSLAGKEREKTREVDLSLVDNSLVLTAVSSDGKEASQVALPLEIESDSGFVTAALDFRIFDNSVTVRVGFGSGLSEENWKALSWEGETEGEGRARIGAGRRGVVPADEWQTPCVADWSSDKAAAIFTELAVFYAPIPAGSAGAGEEAAEAESSAAEERAAQNAAADLPPPPPQINQRSEAMPDESNPAYEAEDPLE